MADNKLLTINKDLVIENWDALTNNDNNDLIKTSLEDLTCTNFSGDFFIGTPSSYSGAGRTLKTGIFFFLGDGTVTGAPDNFNKGWLISYRARKNGIKQFYCPYDNNNIYTRTFNGSNFTEWQRVMIQQDVYYTSGDIIELNNNYDMIGHVTDSSKQIVFTINLPKSLYYINNFTINEMRLKIRDNGQYVERSVEEVNFKNYNIDCYKNNDYSFVVVLTKGNDTAWYKPDSTTVIDNNQPVAVSASWIKITLS